MSGFVANELSAFAWPGGSSGDILFWALLDLPFGVVVGQLPRAVKDRQLAIRIAVDADFDIDVVAAVLVLRDLKGESFEGGRSWRGGHSIVPASREKFSPKKQQLR